VDAEPVPVDDAAEATDVAEAVTAEPETLKPIEETPAEQVTGATAEPQTASQAERMEPEATESKPAPAVTETAPEVLATDRADLVAAWDVVSRWFGAHDAPSTLLGVTVLGYRDQLVEVEAVAAVTG